MTKRFKAKDQQKAADERAALIQGIDFSTLTIQELRIIAAMREFPANLRGAINLIVGECKRRLDGVR
jgi:hypothetical protein